MIANNIEPLLIPEKFFGHKIEAGNHNLSRTLGIIASLVLITFFILLAHEETGILLSSTVLFIFILVLASSGLALVYEVDRRDMVTEKKILASYNKWYRLELLPFLSKKYNLEFDTAPDRNGKESVFWAAGELARKEDGTFVRIKVNGITWGSLPLDSYKKKNHREHPGMVFTNSDDISIEVVSELPPLYNPAVRAFIDDKS